MRVAARTDDNQREIVEMFRKLGCTVLDLSKVGKGCPDILVGAQSRNHLVEIKDGSKPPSKRRLTADQTKFHRVWRGDVHVVQSLADVAVLVSYWRKL
jgi:Holliday junction resolvase